jgi:hypothetical protein
MSGSTGSLADYTVRGSAYQIAWRTLVEGCDVPPSLEVFDHELALARRGKPMMTPEAQARRLAAAYQRVGGFFPEDE